jgi:mono/diheme cytochrome c family protein
MNIREECSVMNKRLRNVALICAGSVLFGTALAAGPVQKWTRVSVELPASKTLFPPGNGADLANGQCLMCHSAGMVLRQPPLTQEEWVGEINKMRNAFGAPLPADQVNALAMYLHTLNGRQSHGGPSAADAQGS